MTDQPLPSQSSMNALVEAKARALCFGREDIADGACDECLAKAREIVGVTWRFEHEAVFVPADHVAVLDDGSTFDGPGIIEGPMTVRPEAEGDSHA